jgi:hypothetical protein
MVVPGTAGARSHDATEHASGRARQIRSQARALNSSSRHTVRVGSPACQLAGQPVAGPHESGKQEPTCMYVSAVLMFVLVWTFWS